MNVSGTARRIWAGLILSACLDTGAQAPLALYQIQPPQPTYLDLLPHPIDALNPANPIPKPTPPPSTATPAPAPIYGAPMPPPPIDALNPAMTGPAEFSYAPPAAAATTPAAAGMATTASASSPSSTATDPSNAEEEKGGGSALGKTVAVGAGALAVGGIIASGASGGGSAAASAATPSPDLPKLPETDGTNKSRPETKPAEKPQPKPEPEPPEPDPQPKPEPQPQPEPETTTERPIIISPLSTNLVSKATEKIRETFQEKKEEIQARPFTYYVSPSGDDSNRGTKPDAPWKSINRVEQHMPRFTARALRKPVIIYFSNIGTWETEEFEIFTRGTQENNITFDGTSWGNGPEGSRATIVLTTELISEKQIKRRNLVFKGIDFRQPQTEFEPTLATSETSFPAPETSSVSKDQAPTPAAPSRPFPEVTIIRFSKMPPQPQKTQEAPLTFDDLKKVTFGEKSSEPKTTSILIIKQPLKFRGPQNRLPPEPSRSSTSMQANEP